jgi:hypothetical protein
MGSVIIGRVASVTTCSSTSKSGTVSTGFTLGIYRGNVLRTEADAYVKTLMGKVGGYTYLNIMKWLVFRHSAW